MEIPIASALYKKDENTTFKNNKLKYNLLNGKNFSKPDIKEFPVLKLLNYKFNKTFFEIILVTINDELVNKYLENKISYISILKIMFILLKKPYLTRYYKSSPKNINEIKNMVEKTKKYLNEYLNFNVTNI